MLPKTHLMPTAPVKWDARLQGVFRGVNLYLECVNMCQYMTGMLEVMTRDKLFVTNRHFDWFIAMQHTLCRGIVQPLSPFGPFGHGKLGARHPEELEGKNQW